VNKTTIDHIHLPAETLIELGWTIDRTCYPWVAYKGDRFNPTDWATIDTPAYTRGV
jgi:hypothetical protein